MIRVNLFNDTFYNEPIWWRNFCDDLPILRLSTALEITEKIREWNVTFNVEYDGMGWRYLEFNSEADYTAFVLRWSY